MACSEFQSRDFLISIIIFNRAVTNHDCGYLSMPEFDESFNGSRVRDRDRVVRADLDERLDD